MDSQTHLITTRQISRLFTLSRRWKWTNDQIHIYIDMAFQVSSVRQLTPVQYESFCRTVSEAPYIKALCYYIFFIEDDSHREDRIEKVKKITPKETQEDLWNQMELFKKEEK